MTTLRKAAQRMLAAVEDSGHKADVTAAADDLRAALAQQDEPVQEPVAWYQKRGQEVLTSHPACWGREDEPWTPLYTAPPRCPNCASLEAQNTELDRRLTELEQPVQEPVAKVELMTTGGNAGLATRIVEIDDHLRERLRPGQLLYTAPPQRKPLTQEEIDRICASLGFAAISPAEIVRAVERAHGIKE